ncbi:MAG: hypothetical protein J5760_07130 [Clostridia bacterium]|nr:hypothetical protein [Clostridia bacterium]
MKKLLSLTVAVLMLCLAFASCGGSDGDNDSSAAQSKTELSAPEQTSSELSAPEDPGENSGSGGDIWNDGFKYATDEFYGKTVRIFTVSTTRHTYAEVQFAPVDEENVPDTVNNAVRERNDYIYDHYGVTIETRVADYPSEFLLEEIYGSTANYDLVCESVDRMVNRISDKLFIPLDDYFDFSDSWWDSRCMDNLSLDGVKHYFVSGECMLTDVDHIYLTLYNKNLYANNADLVATYGDLYDLVRENKFTLDAYTQMSRAVSHPDENGEYGIEGTFGNLSHSYGATIMVNGCGVSMVEKSADGLRCAVADDYAQTVFDKVYDLMHDRTITQRAELIIGKAPEGSNSRYGFAELEYMFRTGKGLFYNTTVNSISILKNKDLGFTVGILPICHFSEDDSEYYCPVNRYQSSVIGIPVSNVENVEVAAFVLNALGYYNTELPSNVKNAYYELTLKLQASDSEDDFDMLDLIFKSRFYDLGSIFPIDVLTGMYGSLINAESNTLTSYYAAHQNEIEDALAKTYADYIDSLS